MCAGIGEGRKDIFSWTRSITVRKEGTRKLPPGDDGADMRFRRSLSSRGSKAEETAAAAAVAVAVAQGVLPRHAQLPFTQAEGQVQGQVHGALTVGALADTQVPAETPLLNAQLRLQSTSSGNAQVPPAIVVTAADTRVVGQSRISFSGPLTMMRATPGLSGVGVNATSVGATPAASDAVSTAAPRGSAADAVAAAASGAPAGGHRAYREAAGAASSGSGPNSRLASPQDGEAAVSGDGAGAMLAGGSAAASPAAPERSWSPAVVSDAGALALSPVEGGRGWDLPGAGWGASSSNSSSSISRSNAAGGAPGEPHATGAAANTPPASGPVDTSLSRTPLRGSPVPISAPAELTSSTVAGGSSGSRAEPAEGSSQPGGTRGLLQLMMMGPREDLGRDRKVWEDILARVEGSAAPAGQVAAPDLLADSSVSRLSDREEAVLYSTTDLGSSSGGSGGGGGGASSTGVSSGGSNRAGERRGGGFVRRLGSTRSGLVANTSPLLSSKTAGREDMVAALFSPRGRRDPAASELIGRMTPPISSATGGFAETGSDSGDVQGSRSMNQSGNSWGSDGMAGDEDLADGHPQQHQQHQQQQSAHALATRSPHMGGVGLRPFRGLRMKGKEERERERLTKKGSWKEEKKKGRRFDLRLKDDADDALALPKSETYIAVAPRADNEASTGAGGSAPGSSSSMIDAPGMGGVEESCDEEGGMGEVVPEEGASGSPRHAMQQWEDGSHMFGTLSGAVMMQSGSRKSEQDR